jgi:HAD superfamily hydrolase (TIGR01549 family)
MQAKAILFDLDDTLWPIAPVIVTAELRVLTWLQAEAPAVAARFSTEELRQRRMDLLAREPRYAVDLGALRRTVLTQAFAEAGEDLGKIDAAMAVFFAARNAVTLFDDVLPALAQLAQLARLGTVTNGNADLAAIGLAPYFAYSLSAAQFGRAKPAAGIFHAACAAMGVAPHEALYVGDDILLDVQGAQQAGLRAAWINRSGSDADVRHGVRPDYRCTDLMQLLQQLSASAAQARPERA